MKNKFKQLFINEGMCPEKADLKADECRLIVMEYLIENERHGLSEMKRLRMVVELIGELNEEIKNEIK